MNACSFSRLGAAFSLCCLASLLTGCPNPNIYGTPRTTPKGEISHTVAVEAIRLSGDVETATTSGGTEKKSTSITVPTFPTYQLRYGATENLDLGFSIRNASSLGFDAKYNPVRGESFDLALDPGMQFFRISSTSSTGESAAVSIFYLHLPVLLGFNVSESLSVVATPGAVYALATGTSSSSSGSDRDSLSSSSGFLARLGLGLNIRPSKRFAMQPEVTAMRAFNDSSTMIYMIGLGFNFGTLPSFGSGAATAPN